ncbi:hypothetical protein RSPO_c01746 [Ralstonia solanacearum Po82]|uniref:Uncharacterized protein n=1 Tax=Ralstonia solanacearum (strain Po82) TaxID=1031711 RepID=F6G1H5_RALS8|nr:hypothetical protein RSPO_c01746 [Ralstonia solanacearum Po82]
MRRTAQRQQQPWFGSWSCRAAGMRRGGRIGSTTGWHNRRVRAGKRKTHIMAWNARRP